jgi:hypothetical protein
VCRQYVGPAVHTALACHCLIRAVNGCPRDVQGELADIGGYSGPNRAGEGATFGARPYALCKKAPERLSRLQEFMRQRLVAASGPDLDLHERARAHGATSCRTGWMIFAMLQRRVSAERAKG